MTRCGPIFRIAFYLVASLGLTAGCSSEPAEGGKVEIAWNVGPNAKLNSASYWIVAPNGNVTSGTVAVGSTSQVPVTVGPLPIATGYNLLVSGVATDGQTGCSGSATFDITSSGNTVVTVGLECSTTAPGQVVVIGSTNVCPLIDGVSASPGSAVVGSTMGLVASGHDADSQPSPLGYTWSVNGGATLSATTGTDITLTCTAPGSVTVTLTASDGDAGCNDQLSFNVTCTVQQ